VTIYGNECGNGGFILFSGGLVVGEFSEPQEITETYIGEPYITYADAGILGGRQGYKPQVRRGDGLIIVEDAPRDAPVLGTFSAPANEAGNWSITIAPCTYWSGSWNPYNGGAVINLRKIARYLYTSTPV
jgi:hypothetical protein